MRLNGCIDQCDSELLRGWVFSPDFPTERLAVEVFSGDRLLGNCVADQFRADLLAAGLGDGHCAYRFPMPAFLPKSDLPSVRVKLTNTDVYLMQKSVAPGGTGPSSHSRFGSLWIDRSDWMDVLSRRHRDGAISDAVSEAICQFVRDGYLIIPGAVPHERIDALNAELEGFWRHPPVGLQIETFEPDRQMRLIPPDIRFRAGTTKLLDLFAFSDVTRQAIASPKVVEFLAAIFEDKPKAFRG